MDYPEKPGKIALSQIDKYWSNLEQWRELCLWIHTHEEYNMQ